MHFSKFDDGLMETAIIYCRENVRGFPQVADIKNAIREIQRDLRTEPRLQQLPQRANWMSSKAAEAFEVDKSGKAQAYLDSQDYTELHTYAKLSFPEISLELVKINANEIQYCMDENNRCRGCGYSDGNCIPNSGYHPVLYLRKNGVMQYDMMRCAKKREYKNEMPSDAQKQPYSERK